MGRENLAKNPHKFQKGSTVVVAMSGGVDSSVTAALLKEEGYLVIGVTMKTYASEGEGSHTHGCCTLSDVDDARHVASILEIPHYVLNMKSDFEQKIIAPFVSDYLSGKTPNPCVRCNTYIKFDALLEKAKALGAAGIATGHYAQVWYDASQKRYALHCAVDAQKDQSYVLFELSQHQLAHMMLPLGWYEKPKVRALAETLELPTARKKDSYEICFVPSNRYTDFVASRVTESCEGPVCLSNGTVVGKHKGVFRYTVGQRKRLAIPGHPDVCVTGIDGNTLYVGPEKEAYATRMVVSRCHWHTDPLWDTPLKIKIRAHHEGVMGKLTDAGEGSVRVECLDPVRAVTPGQAAVWYQEDQVIGGGWIVQAGRTRN